MQLPNGTILEPKNSVKWLGVCLDRKLNYKKHIETRIASANRSFFAIQNLMKSEWGLNPTACRQLYLSCIIPISDYGSEIWFFFIFIYLFYLFIKCIQPKVMTLNYFKIWFYFTNKSTLYNPTIYRQYCPVFTPC